MKSLRESLFDHNLVKDDVTTLYDLFGSHIKKFRCEYGSDLGWTHYFNQTAVVREWKKEGRPTLSGGFAKTTFPSDLQKFIAVILKNTIITKKQLLQMSEDGNFDNRYLNDKLDDYEILLPEGSKWGASNSRRIIRVQIKYIEYSSANPGDDMQFRNVGNKIWKGLNTDKIEIGIYCYNPKSAGFGSHVWTLLTDLSIKDLK